MITACVRRLQLAQRQTSSPREAYIFMSTSNPGLFHYRSPFGAPGLRPPCNRHRLRPGIAKAWTTMILVAYRHGLRAAELADLR